MKIGLASSSALSARKLQPGKDAAWASATGENMKTFLLPLALFVLLCPALAQRDFNIDGPMELHIWLTAKPGQEKTFEKTFREVFYPAVSARDGFRGALLMRKPGTSDYIIRLSFDTEEQRVQWVKSDAHQKAFPALTSHCKEEPTWDGFAVIYPK